MATAAAEEKWFHADLSSREEAGQLLRDNGFAEGLFLVRPSTSAIGDFVLSVVHKDSVIHYQIRRRGEDALFSLSEEQKVSEPHRDGWIYLSLWLAHLSGSGTRVPPPVQEVMRSNLGWGSLRVWAVSCPISYNTGWA